MHSLVSQERLGFALPFVRQQQAAVFWVSHSAIPFNELHLLIWTGREEHFAAQCLQQLVWGRSERFDD